MRKAGTQEMNWRLLRNTKVSSWRTISTLCQFVIKDKRYKGKFKNPGGGEFIKRGERLELLVLR